MFNLNKNAIHDSRFQRLGIFWPWTAPTGNTWTCSSSRLTSKASWSRTSLGDAADFYANSASEAARQWATTPSLLSVSTVPILSTLTSSTAKRSRTGPAKVSPCIVTSCNIWMSVHVQLSLTYPCTPCPRGVPASSTWTYPGVIW